MSTAFKSRLTLFSALVLCVSPLSATRAQEASHTLPITAAESWLYGTDGDRIYLISPDTAEVLQVGDTQNRTVGDVAVTPAGEVYVAGRALLRLNRANGIATLVENITGLSGLTAEALASDGSGRLFGSTFYRLFELQPTTAVARVLTSLDINPSDIAFGPDGNLYAVIGPAVSGNTDRLIRINPVNGQAVLVGNIGFRSVDGIAFGPDGRLFGSANAATLILINPATGAGTAVGVFSNFRSMVGLGSRPPVVSPPANVRATVVGFSLTVAWDSIPGAAYILEAGSGPGLSNLFNGPVGNNTSVTATVPAGTYYLRVRAGTALGTSGPSAEAVATVGTPGPPGPGCTPPTGLTSNLTGNVLTLQWVAAAGASSYQLEAGAAPGLSNILTVNLGAGTTQQFNIAGAPRMLYYVRVRALGACGTSVGSNEVIVDLR